MESKYNLGATANLLLELPEIQYKINDNDFTFISDITDLVACKQLIELFLNLKFEDIFILNMDQIQKMERHLPNDLHELITLYGDWRWYALYEYYFKNNYNVTKTSPTGNANIDDEIFQNYWIDEKVEMQL